jgi:hypothetical protein
MQKVLRIGLVIMVLVAGVSCESDSSSPASGIISEDSSSDNGNNNSSSDEGGGDESSSDESIPWDSVQWVNGNGTVAGWAETVNIDSASIAGGIVQWSYATAPGAHWTGTPSIHGDPIGMVGWVAEIDGTWYGAMGEWLTPGLTWQQTIMFKSDRGNTRLFGPPLQNYVPASGQVFHIFVCGLNFAGLSNVQERSNLVRVVHP